jgi:hypothetical protein
MKLSAEEQEIVINALLNSLPGLTWNGETGVAFQEPEALRARSELLGRLLKKRAECFNITGT